MTLQVFDLFTKECTIFGETYMYVYFYDTTASTWTLATSMTTWECESTWEYELCNMIHWLSVNRCTFTSMILFSKSNEIALGYLDPINFSSVQKRTNKVRGDVSNTSAKTNSLLYPSDFFSQNTGQVVTPKIIYLYYQKNHIYRIKVSKKHLISF